MAGISNFARLTQFHNVCRMFTIIHDNVLDYYIGTNMASDGAVHATRNATHLKLQPIKHRRTSDELCFQLKGIKNWNDLPHKITALQDVLLFKNNVAKFIYNSI